MDNGENLLYNRTMLLGIFIAAIFVVLTYILKLFNNDEKVEDSQKNEKSVHPSEKKKELSSNKPKKKVSDKWSTRVDKQGFTHPWLIKSLKGHTGQVLGMDFSSNNKYLISCADEDPGGSTESSSSSNSDCTKNSCPSSVDSSPKVKGLSRRQRKNRRKEDISPEAKRKSKKKIEIKSNTKQSVTTPLKIWIKLKMEEHQLYRALLKYLLSTTEMLTMGYPMVVNDKNGHVLIYKNGFKKFDVNAQEFIPKTSVKKNSLRDEYDSGQGSGSSSDSGETLDDRDNVSEPHSVKSKMWSHRYKTQANQLLMTGKLNIQIPVFPVLGARIEPSISLVDTGDGYPLLNVSAVYTGASFMPFDYYPIMQKRTCVRCSANFLITDQEYISKESCRYHWGKLHKAFSDPNCSRYSCCQAQHGSRGCSESRFHVWNGTEEGQNYFIGYVQTRHKKMPPADGNFGVYALDCEMSYTVRGLEVTKVTVVGADGRIVYDSFVRPDLEVVDYNTRFSGITCKDMKYAKTLREVQNDLMGFINADSIIIGHGLENDLRALKITHQKVVDTSYSFPHILGLPFRRSLKQLARYVLQRDIQNGKHSSYEDAVASLELILSLVRKENQHYQN